MKIEELVEGEVYTTDVKHPGYTFQAKGNCKGIAYMVANAGKFNGERPGQVTPDLVTSFGTYRLATPQEKEHLQQCIAAGKYVDYVESKLSFNYLIL